MNLTPQEFLASLKEGKTEKELNKILSPVFYNKEISELIRYGHTLESAKEHLSTDYSNGFTICSKCGTYYELGKGFIKHLSKGCLHCEGEEKHKVYWVNASEPKYGGFPARFMAVYFDDGMSYCRDKAVKELFKDLI